MNNRDLISDIKRAIRGTERQILIAKDKKGQDATLGILRREAADLCRIREVSRKDHRTARAMLTAVSEQWGHAKKTPISLAA